LAGLILGELISQASYGSGRSPYAALILFSEVQQTFLYEGISLVGK
jgi:hypothetical protein